MVSANSPGERVLGDDELAARARHGDRDAFGTLMRRHQRAALRVAAVIGGTDEAGDVVQEAMIKAFASLTAHRGDGSVRAWLLRIVANEAKNHLRGRTRRLHRDDRHARLELRSADTAEVDAIAALERQRVAAALARLALNDRTVLACRFVAGLSEAETADALRLPPGTVKSRTSRALSRLREELEAS